MPELLTAARMRAIEAAAIDGGEVTGLELMERAGRGVVEAIMDWRPDLARTAQRALVLAGPGNNGGDGFVVARLLRQRGWEVELLLHGDEGRLPPDAAENARRWRRLGKVAPLTAAALAASSPFGIWVDALFGTGLTRPLEGDLARVLEEIARPGARFAGCGVAVDLPSGLCADSGRWLGPGHRMDMTVTFHRAKLGHFLADGPRASGALVVKTIGLRGGAEADVALTTPAGRAVTKQNGHKYDHGHALILSGGPGKGGAARLAARGALRIGAGLVTLGCPPAALQENAARLDAVMLAAIKEPGELTGEFTARKIKAACIGPGFGPGDRLGQCVALTLAERAIATVLDADALSAYESAPETLFERLHENCILTPHAGEFARLFPDLAARLEAPATRGPAYSKLDATRAAAARAGCTVLFKGADTVIAAPDGRAAINAAQYDRSAPWLATAGAGDVLAGFITGLLARGLAPFEACESAAWLHVECARRFGPGLIAEDLPEMLPGVFRARAQ